MERADLTTRPAAGAVAGAPAEIDEVDLVPVRTYWQLVRERFMQHRLAVMSLVILAILIVFSVAIPALTGDAYRTSNLTRVDGEPSLIAPLGYNEIGQNQFVALMKATQNSLIIGFCSVLIIASIGSLVGSVAGYMGGWVDNLLMRVVDVVLSLPFFFLILIIVAFFGVGDVRVIIIAIGITGWTVAARLVRAEFLRIREADYVQAARALGVGHRRIIVRHMLPSAMAPLVVACALGVADAIITEAALSFLGFGISRPEPSLGNMLNNARDYFYSNVERIFYPGVILVLLVLCASFLGDGLRDALDPRQKVKA
jgi:peptide/nickel transport system permease protein